MVQRRASLAPDLKRKSALWVMTRKRKDTYSFRSCTGQVGDGGNWVKRRGGSSTRGGKGGSEKGREGKGKGDVTHGGGGGFVDLKASALWKGL